VKLRTDGEVQAQFVVDTLGIADLTSFKILQSPHELFSKAMMSAVAQTIYEPAEIKGRRVKQRVVQRFYFEAPR
jgi:protein TonB